MHVAEAALKLEQAEHKANTAVPSDTVKINGVADTTKVSEVPIMPEKEYSIALELFLKLQHREPYPSEEPDREQMTALLHIIGARWLPCGFGPVGELTTFVC